MFEYVLLFHLKDITSKQKTAYVWTTQSDEFQPVKIIIIKMGNLSITSKSLLLPFCNPPLSYAPPQCFFHLQATTDLLSVTIDQFAFSRILYTWNYTLCIYFCLASFTHCNDFAIHSWWHSDGLEKEMATHSSTLAWKIPWTEEPGKLQSMGSQIYQ